MRLLSALFMALAFVPASNTTLPRWSFFLGSLAAVAALVLAATTTTTTKTCLLYKNRESRVTTSGLTLGSNRLSPTAPSPYVFVNLVSRRGAKPRRAAPVHGVLA